MIKKSVFLITFLLIIFLASFSIIAFEDIVIPYNSYIYNYWGNPVHSPEPYTPSNLITSQKLGFSLRTPRDLFVDHNDFVYLLDTGNDRLIILDDNFNVDKVIDSFINREKEDVFSSPEGIFVTLQGDIYIADTGNRRVVALDKDGELLRIIESPVSETEGIIPDNYNYRPTKLVLDSAGRLFVVSRETYEGLLEFDVDGRFSGFIGAPPIEPDMFDYFWSRFVASDAQRARMKITLPTEFSNIDIDRRGFLYTTTSDLDREDRIRRLNPAGKDVLRRTGELPPIGDLGSVLRDDEGELILPPSRFVDIDIGRHDIYSVLDVERGRIFTYDGYGDLLYVFGNRALQKGAFSNPVALASRSDNSILVLDSSMERITVFKPTEYQQTIYGAIESYNTGKYDLSTDYWKNVLQLNRNYDLAYSGIAEAYFRQNDYSAAMTNYRLGHNRKGYS
ncbi:MAG: gluconolactonase, partial [Halanaerobiales bacterium]